MPNDETLRHIDRVIVLGNDIHISGWALQCKECRDITLIFPHNERITLHEEHWRRDSPDIKNIYGPQYDRVRFEIITPFPRNIPVKDIGLISLSFDRTPITRCPLFTFQEKWSWAAHTPLHELKIGIGVPTYNRAETLPQIIHHIFQNTSLPFKLFISDDGSQDTTRSVVQKIPHIAYGRFRNRGIAWNKNRILFYLKEIEKCDVIIMIEDDMFPASFAWEIDWVLAALRLGHVNFAHPHQKADEGGIGVWHDPVISYSLSGQCTAFARDGLSYVGYLDPRFGRYGHEHVEHTLRFIRMGYGGRSLKEKDDHAFYLLRSDLVPIEVPSHGSDHEVAKAAKLFKNIKDDVAYRSPWLPDDVSIAHLRDEMGYIQKT